ncbi:MAG: cobalamin-binding protein [Actinomycetota bacterium]|nr:cobalamin-binding protein [Actinomycetota bacterium]
MKIVSLLPSATEIAFALGLGDQLEAVTYECDFPAEARSKPVVSDTALPQDRPLEPGDVDRLVGEFMARQQPIYALDKDLIQKIQPDLILAQDLCRVCAVPSGQVEDALAELGCRAEVISLDPNTLDDILDGIVAVGRATGTEAEAGDLVAALRARIETVRTTARRLPSIRTLALEWGDPPFAGGHWVPEMVEIAGGWNVISAPKEPSREVTWRDIADAAPEVIVFMPCGYYLEEAETELEKLLDLPDLAETPAARGGGLFAVDATSYFSRPGPRIVDGLEVVAWTIHPEAFPEPPADRVTRVR